MKPLYFTIHNDLDLLVIPDSDAHANGHVVLTYTYSIYKNFLEAGRQHIISLEEQLHLNKQTSPYFMGVLTFEQPGKLFTYSAGEFDTLNVNQVEELIEMISHYRDTPSMWEVEL